MNFNMRDQNATILIRYQSPNTEICRTKKSEFKKKMSNETSKIGKKSEFTANTLLKNLNICVQNCKLQN